MDPKRKVGLRIAIALAVVSGIFIGLLLMGFSTVGWGPKDTITVFIGVAIAGIQVLLVYALFDPVIEQAKLKQTDQEWTNAVREFLALCSMMARDLSHGLAYHIEETDQKDGTIVLRNGIDEVLRDIPEHANAFDMMSRLCSNAFSDKDLARLSQISSDLQSCALNAKSASQRIALLGNAIPHFRNLEPKDYEDHTFLRRDLAKYPEGIDRTRCWLVRDIDEIIEPMIDACTELKRFAFGVENGDDFPLAKSITYIEESARYRRAIQKQQDRRKRREKEEGKTSTPTMFESMRTRNHIKVLDQSKADLEKYNKKIEAKGICIAWVPEEFSEGKTGNVVP